MIQAMFQQQQSQPKRISIFEENPILTPNIKEKHMPFHISLHREPAFVLDHRQRIGRNTIGQLESRKRASRSIFSRSINQNARSGSINHSSLRSQSKNIGLAQLDDNSKKRRHRIFSIDQNLQVDQAGQCGLDQRLKEMISHRNSKNGQARQYNYQNQENRLDEKRAVVQNRQRISSQIQASGQRELDDLSRNNQQGQRNIKDGILSPKELSQVLKKIKKNHQHRQIRIIKQQYSTKLAPSASPLIRFSYNQQIHLN